MNRRERDALDRHVTGNYGEDQYDDLEQRSIEELEGTEQKRTVSQLAQEAIDIQDACNLLGLSKAYAQALQDLYDTGTLNGLPDLEKHPINRLWLNKLCDLSRIMIDDIDDAYPHNRVFKDCEELARSEVKGG